MSKRGKIVKERRVAGVLIRLRQTTEYTCNTCKTTYPSLKEAVACAAMPVEKALYKVGDKVTWIGSAVCQHGKHDKSFRVNGTVVSIGPAEPVDEETNLKWMRARMTNLHARQFEVSYPCVCGRKRNSTHWMYSGEMRPRIEKRKYVKMRKK